MSKKVVFCAAFVFYLSSVSATSVYNVSTLSGSNEEYGSLGYWIAAINGASPNDGTIDLKEINGGAINLLESLTPITGSISIVNTNSVPFTVTIDGDGSYRAFSVQSGTFSIDCPLSMQNVFVQGENASFPGGGGALGAGAGLFIASGINVILSETTTFTNCVAVGGSGSASGSSGGTGGTGGNTDGDIILSATFGDGGSGGGDGGGNNESGGDGGAGGAAGAGRGARIGLSRSGRAGSRSSAGYRAPP